MKSAPSSSATPWPSVASLLGPERSSKVSSFRGRAGGRWTSGRRRGVTPTASTLTLTPSSGVTVEGQTLVFLCEAPAGEGERRFNFCAASRDDFELKFYFYRNGVQIPPGQRGAQTSNNGSFSQLFYPKIPKDFGGKFSCGVEEEVGGTWVPSPPSETVEVTVKATKATLRRITRFLLHLLLFHSLCSATGPVAQRNFSFYKDGDQQFSMITLKERAHFSIPVAKDTITTGHFSCRYEEKVNDRWIPSPFSQAMMVTTQARSQLLPLVAGGVAGGVMLLLGLLLAVCPMAYVDGGDP